MRLASFALPFVVAAVLAGCGSSSSSSSSSGGTASSSRSSSSGAGPVLTETEFKITPAKASVSKTGQVTVTVRNGGAITHALAVKTPSGLVRTGSIAPGASTTLTVNFSKPGSYRFYCPIANHASLGMRGLFVVAGGAAAARPHTASSSASSGGSGNASGSSSSGSGSSGGSGAVGGGGSGGSYGGGGGY